MKRRAEVLTSKEGKKYQNQTTFAFSSQAEHLLQKIDFTGGDGIKTSISREQSRYNGRLLSSTDELGNVTQ
ncbi:hypothetical protein [Coxiella burnetii]